MPKNEATVPDSNAIPAHKHQTTTGKIRGYDKIAPFLHKVNKIVADECVKQATYNTLSWYSTWESWNNKHLIQSPSINNIGKITCPELKYTERTIEQIVNIIITDITPIDQYIQMNHVF